MTTPTPTPETASPLEEAASAEPAAAPAVAAAPVAEGPADPAPAVVAQAPAARPRRGTDLLIALALGVLSVAWLLGVEGRQGIGRDEAQYFRAAERYWGWFAELGDNLKAGRLGQSFSQGGVETYWGDNPEHPVVMKTIFAFTWRLFHRCECPQEAAWHPIAIKGKHTTLPLFTRDSTAFRFGAILFAALGVALVYLFGRRFAGRPAGVAAAVLSLAQPHYFFHAQIAAFDAPITVMAVAVGYAYWKSLRSAKWGILTGVIFGIALGVKHNAWVMPALLVGHYVWMRRGDLRRLRPPRLPLAFASMLVLGPMVFFLHWPKVWVNPITHTRFYLLRHLQHEHYNFEYLGRNWNNPPKELPRKLLRLTFPFFSTGFTVPVTTLALFAAGTVVLVRRGRKRGDETATETATEVLAPEPALEPAEKASWLRPGADVDRAPGAFFLVQILGPMAAVALPSTPVFGGVKHFMPAAPYMAIVAGIGLVWVARVVAAALPSARLARAAAPALVGVVTLPAVLETQRSHPDGLSHYNLLAGGFAGGATLGMNRQFWGYSVLPMLDDYMKLVPRSRATYWHDVMGDAINMYVRDGRLKPGLGNVGVGEEIVGGSDLGLLIWERHFVLYEGLFWDGYGTTQPVYVRTREGVPLVTVYRRPGVP